MKTEMKVFLMALIGFFVTTLSTIDKFNVWYLVIVTVVFASSYAVKNWLLPSDSGAGVANWRDLLSGLIVAVNMALSNFAAMLLTGTEFSLKVFGATILGAVLGYFTKTIPQSQKT